MVFEFGEKNSRLTQRQNKTVALESLSCPFFSRQDPIVKLGTSVQLLDRWQLTALVLMSFVHDATLCGHFISCQRSLLEEANKLGTNKRNLDE